ncbi:MAG: hypothetical protein WCZ86_06255 [Desulfurivibrionaceae bacterium]
MAELRQNPRVTESLPPAQGETPSLCRFYTWEDTAGWDKPGAFNRLLEFARKAIADIITAYAGKEPPNICLTLKVMPRPKKE